MPVPEVLATAPARRSLLLGSALAAVAASAAAGGLGYWLKGDELAGLLGLIGGAASVLSGLLVPAWIIDAARARVAEAQERVDHPSAAAPALGMLSEAGQDAGLLLAHAESRLRLLAGWPQGLVALILATTGALPVILAQPAITGENQGELALGIAALVAAFPFLVASHRLHAIPARRLPEAPALARLLRLLTWTLVVGGCTAMTRSFGLEWTVWGQWAMTALIASVAAEQALRALAAPFLPVAHASEAKALGDSALLALVATRGGSGSLAAGLKERFGIDLAQSWALRFLRRAAAPLGALLLLIAWLLTGLTALGTGERGVYERCGVADSVLPPGLHAHLPWPFGIVRRSEYGQIHELILAQETPKDLPSISAEADTPADFDRLWDKAHPADASYLVPAAAISGGQVAHQLMSSDVRICWRVGLEDGAARQALYAVEIPEDLVRRQAGRLLAHAYANRTLAQLIGEDRDKLAGVLKTDLAKALTGSGIEVTAVVIDAIHPPLGAVPSYHGVQAAEIAAGTDTAKARTVAAQALAEANREAAGRKAGAEATAGEQIAKAGAETTRFQADGQAFQTAPEAMALERQLQAQGRALGKAQVTVIDHRLKVTDGPVVDLRPAGTPRD